MIGAADRAHLVFAETLTNCWVSEIVVAIAGACADAQGIRYDVTNQRLVDDGVERTACVRVKASSRVRAAVASLMPRSKPLLAQLRQASLSLAFKCRRRSASRPPLCIRRVEASHCRRSRVRRLRRSRSAPSAVRRCAHRQSTCRDRSDVAAVDAGETRSSDSRASDRHCRRRPSGTPARRG